jgi:Family of unknown function (DUF6210)
MLPRVTLWNVEGVVLILLTQSGVVYSNQTGGPLCHQSEAEGILVPFNNDYPLDQPDLSLERLLARLLANAQYLTSQLADNVDALLLGSHDTSCAKVDRARLEESMEAWVCVDVDDAGDFLISGFGRCKGVITWRNSD